MSAPRLRSQGAVLLAVVCTAVLAGTSILASAFVFGARTLLADVALLAGEGWIMGGTANPEPGPDYISAVEQLYLDPNNLSGYSFSGLLTPEQFCPVICAPVPGDPGLDENFGQSINTGASILDQQIQPISPWTPPPTSPCSATRRAPPSPPRR